MPGIVGLVTKRKPREQAEHDLSRMVRAICHESFYETGTWVDQSLGVYVGWTALTNSFASRMPISNARQDIVLAFSGEDHSELGLGVQGRSYLINSYEEDRAFPKRLNGRFHGLVADRVQGTATLFNDRYGMHRLYYHETKEAFYFAAEAKAILTVRPELRTADVRSLGELVACGCVFENRTIFKGIELLPAAAVWLFRDGSIARRGSYFHPREWEDQVPLESENYYQELRDAFTRSLPRYFQGREPIGVSLTGGLDTRMIMAWHTGPSKSLRCYTFGGMFRDCQDVIVARQIAKACEQPHSVIPVAAEFLTRFPHYAERSVYLADGCVDVNRSTDLYVSEKARQIAPVKIVGTYGSEVLTQVPAFRPMSPTPGLFSPEMLLNIQQAEANYAELRREHPVTFAVFRQSPWWHFGVLGLEQTQLSVRSPYLDNEFVRTVYRAPKSNSTSGDVRLRMIREGNPALGRIRSDRGVGGSAGRISAAVSRGFLEFTFKAEHAYDYAMPQWLARIDHLLSPLQFERAFLGRHKAFHFRVWYRDALHDYVREILLDPRTLARPYLQRTGVEDVVRGHLTGSRNYTTEIHKVLALELLHRLFLESS